MMFMDLMVVNKSEHDLVALCTIAHSLNIDAKRKRPKSSGSGTSTAAAFCSTID